MIFIFRNYLFKRVRLVGQVSNCYLLWSKLNIILSSLSFSSLEVEQQFPQVISFLYIPLTFGHHNAIQILKLAKTYKLLLSQSRASEGSIVFGPGTDFSWNGYPLSPCPRLGQFLCLPLVELSVDLLLLLWLERDFSQITF